MSVSLSLLIPASGLDCSDCSPRAGFGKGLGVQAGDELDEFVLQFGWLNALVRGNEVRYGTLCLQGAERLRDGLVVDRGEEEGGFDLADFHVVDKGACVGGAGITDAVAPDGVEVLGNGGGEPVQVGLQIAVEVGLKDKVLGLEVFFDGGRADVDDIIDDDEPGEMRAGSQREGTLFAGGQGGEILADL